MSEENGGKTAFRVAAALSFPRQTGSAGERAARERVKAALAEAGLTVSEEFFNCSDYAIRVAARAAMVPTGALLLLAALLLHYGFPLAGALAAVASFLPAAYISSRSRTGFHDPHRTVQYRAANVLGRLAGEDPAGRTVLLMAHYDSKSQRFPIWLRIALFIVAAISSFLLIILICAAAIISGLGFVAPFAPILLPAAAALFLLDLAFLLNTAGNRSDGALDNATGVGIIAAIASRLAAAPPPGLRLWVLATAAEEIGLCGANAFLEAHRRDLDPDRTVILNFDGGGAGRAVSLLRSHGLPPARKAPAALLTLTEQVAGELGVPLKLISIPVGMATDLMPFQKAGYQGLDFIGPALQSHSTADRVNLIVEPTLGDYVRVGGELAKRLSRD